MIYAVNGPICGDLSASKRCKGAEQIKETHDLVGRPSSLDRARPPEYAGNAHAAFIGGTYPATEWRVACIRPLIKCWSVIACENHYSVIVFPSISKRIQNLAYMIIGLHYRIAIWTLAGLSCKFRIWNTGEVRPDQGKVYEEGLSGVCLIIDVCNRFVYDLLINKCQRTHGLMALRV